MSSIFRLFSALVLFLSLIPNFSQASKNNNNQLIVLFHGLANNAASFNTMKQGLEQAFPAASVVALTSVEGVKSVTLSIQKQAEENFKELASRVGHLCDQSIVLIGYSQGGIRAYAFLKQYEHLLKVKGLVTLAAPWEGAPGARVDTKMLSEHLTDDVLNDLCMLSISLGYTNNNPLLDALRLEVEKNQNSCLCPGAKDLMVDSLFLDKVKEALPNEKVAILAIGGGQNDFRALLPNKGKHAFKALNSMYTFFTVGEKPSNRNHDMLIPLYSQHALNIVPKNKKNFKRVFIKDVFHSTHVWAIPVPKSKDMLSHPRVLNMVIKFAKSILK